MNIIFLDVDGVILHGEALYGPEIPGVSKHKYLPPEKIALLKRLLIDTHSFLVISSTWRKNDGCKKLFFEAGITCEFFHKDWKTSNIFYADQRHFTRGVQVNEWLSDHPEVEKYVCIDDDRDFFPDQHLVKTEFMTGLTEQHCNQIRRLFA